MLKKARLLHDLLGLLFSLVLCVTGVTGILLNHRDMLLPQQQEEGGGGGSRQPPDLLVPGGQAGLVFRLAGGKLQVTRDGGRAWTEVPARPEGLVAAAFAPDEPQTLYVATRHAALLKSTDLGGTWTDVPNPLPHGDRTTTITDVASGPRGSLTLALNKGGFVHRPAEGAEWVPVPGPPEPPREAPGERRRDLRSLVLALHEGTIVGDWGKLVVDAAAAVLLFLSGTGWWMSWKYGLLRRLRKRESRQPVAV